MTREGFQTMTLEFAPQSPYLLSAGKSIESTNPSYINHTY